MQGWRVRKAVPVNPRPSGCAVVVATLTVLENSALGPVTATIRRKSLPGSARAMVVAVNLPPRTAASHTRSKSFSRVSARMIASLVALRAETMQVRRAFSSSRSSLSRANAMFSANRIHSRTAASSSEYHPAKKSRKTPATDPFLMTGTAAAAPMPACIPNSRRIRTRSTRGRSLGGLCVD